MFQQFDIFLQLLNATFKNGEEVGEKEKSGRPHIALESVTTESLTSHSIPTSLGRPFLFYQFNPTKYLPQCIGCHGDVQEPSM